nr:hypothetical protein [Verrucomicrobiota bacterium]
ERYCQLILEGDADAIRLLLQSSAVGAMDESIAAGDSAIAQARQTLGALESTPAVDALRSLADTIGAMLEGLRVGTR